MKQAWNESVTSSSIISGFRADGIYPYNPNKIPVEAYLPNSLYIEGNIQNNEQLLNNLGDLTRCLSNDQCETVKCNIYVTFLKSSLSVKCCNI